MHLIPNKLQLLCLLRSSEKQTPREEVDMSEFYVEKHAGRVKGKGKTSVMQV